MNDMKKILLCTDGSAYSQVCYEYAAWLAQTMGLEIEGEGGAGSTRISNCLVEVLYVTDKRAEKAVQSSDFSGNIGIDSYQKLLRELVNLEAAKAKINHERAEIILQEAKAFFSDRGITQVKLTHETGFLVDLFHKLEEESDIVVLGKRGEHANFATEHLGANVERIVRSSKKPCLVTPKEFQPVNRVAFAYDGGDSCKKALDYLVNLTALQDLELHIISVVTKNEEKTRNNLEDAANKFKKAGFSPTCEILIGNPELEIEKYIEKNYVDLLVMGAYGHSRIRHLVIGSTTAQMLRISHIPICLFR